MAEENVICLDERRRQPMIADFIACALEVFGTRFGLDRGVTAPRIVSVLNDSNPPEQVPLGPAMVGVWHT
jgi:hypothetical protein